METTLGDKSDSPEIKVIDMKGWLNIRYYTIKKTIFVNLTYL